MSRDRVAAAARADRRLRKNHRAIVKQSPTSRLLMSAPGMGVLSVLAYVSTIEDPVRFDRSRSVGAHLACFSGV
jgi:transposase